MEDFELLRRAGYSNDEIEVFVVEALENAQTIARHPELPSEVLEHALTALTDSLAYLRTAPLYPGPGAAAAPPYPAPPEAAAPPPEKKKGKTLNGIGKLLGGAIAGVGNVLLATGTIVAPNPATAYGAIASSGLAVASIFGGLGDLTGE